MMGAATKNYVNKVYVWQMTLAQLAWYKVYEGRLGGMWRRKQKIKVRSRWARLRAGIIVGGCSGVFWAWLASKQAFGGDGL
jgi:hypothetical protein